MAKTCTSERTIPIYAITYWKVMQMSLFLFHSNQVQNWLLWNICMMYCLACASVVHVNEHVVHAAWIEGKWILHMGSAMNVFQKCTKRQKAWSELQSGTRLLYQGLWIIHASFICPLYLSIEQCKKQNRFNCREHYKKISKLTKTFSGETINIYE